MAAGSTYSPVASTTISGSSTTTVTFSSISGYTDLVIVINSRDTSAGTGNTDMYMQFNSDSGTNYSGTQLYGNGTSAVSNRQTNQTQIYAGSVVPGGTASGTFNTTIINVMNYANSSTYKTVLVRTGLANSLTAARVGLWRSTAAITSLSLYLEPGINWADGSVLTLYGIQAA